jgi:hypothetical protein
MKDDVAERLLSTIMGWDASQAAGPLRQIQILSSLKYDEYEGYRPGVKFVESLARWLAQFQQSERPAALDFVLHRMIFISRVELDHLISLVYPDVIRPHLIERAAGDLGIPRHLVRRIVESPEYQGLERRTLILGLSDGARIDRLRRSSPLSHEQVYLVPELTSERRESLVKKLGTALRAKGVVQPSTFRQIILIDDFYGSGLTLLRKPVDGAWEGKLIRALDEYRELLNVGALSSDAKVLILLYAASTQAYEHVLLNLTPAGLSDWTLKVVLKLPPLTRLGESTNDGEILELSRKYYDQTVTDEHTAVGGGSAALGFNDCRLPVVLSHNTPNNSISLLWADTSDRNKDEGQRALFVRHERHHPERP